jgi:hypothetical protein
MFSLSGFSASAEAFAEGAADEPPEAPSLLLPLPDEQPASAAAQTVLKMRNVDTRFACFFFFFTKIASL